MVFGLFGKKRTEVPIVAPITGEVQPITAVPDPVFSERMMGDGFAVMPTGGQVVAPVDGEVVNVFPTGHAIGIRTPEGIEVLVHVGVDTVKLGGNGFTTLVKEGAKVKAGQPIVAVDWEAIRPQVPSIVTPVVFTDLNGWTLTVNREGAVTAGDAVATATKG